MKRIEFYEKGSAKFKFREIADKSLQFCKIIMYTNLIV